ncbi:hypothetical protein HK104_004197 [Borealophlyctis nickersoniae]|nr:hypothetical protein HK104_004197 [Borealophlyctis nickersoniae]
MVQKDTMQEDDNESLLPQTTQPPTPRPSQKLLYLEGLRGVAAWQVANEHLCGQLLAPFGHTVSRSFQTVFAQAGLGVSIFFILSGRVLVASFLKRRDPSLIASAAFRRPFRLGLPLVGALAIHILFFWFGAYNVANRTRAHLKDSGFGESWYGTPGDEKFYHSFGSFLWAVPKLLLFGQQFPFPIGVTWTMVHEFWNSYYVYLYAVVIAFTPHNRYLLHAVVIFLNWWRLTWATSFFTGVLLSDLAHDGYLRRLAAWRWVWPLCIFLATYTLVILLWDGVQPVIIDRVLAGPFKSWQPDGNGNFPYSGLADRGFWEYNTRHGTVSACVVLLFEITPMLQRLFSKRLFTFLGEVSFMLYLLHPIVHYTVASVVIGGLVPTFSYGAAATITYIIDMAFIFVASWFAFKYIDTPSINAAKWLDNKLFRGDGVVMGGAKYRAV